MLNALSGYDRAIVTNIEGTTRDVLEEQVRVGGIVLNLMDTAGIRETSDEIEKIGVDRALKYAEDADLILYVVDASRSLDENDEKILDYIYDRKFVILLNKSDLNVQITQEILQNRIKEKYEENFIINISAKNGTGIEEFVEMLKKICFRGELRLNEEVYITNLRQKEALQRAREALGKVEESIGMGMPEDFYSIDMMDAYEALGTITGETVGEDLINEIFSKFCMGK